MSANPSISKPPTSGKDPPPPSASPSAAPASSPVRPSPMRNPTSDSLPPPASVPPSISPAPGPQMERPPFSPFFTLIHDPQTTTTHHPTRIHYLFADDDDSLLTAACLRSLSSHSQPPSARSSVRNSSTSSSSSATFRHAAQKGKAAAKAPPKEKERPRREERVLVIDVNETGDGITGASSLSPNWQILNASLEKAPQWEGGDEGGLMLKVEGVGGVGGDETVGLGLDGAGRGDEDEMQRLLESFDAKMALLRRVVEGAGGAVGKEEQKSGGDTALEQKVIGDAEVREDVDDG